MNAKRLPLSDLAQQDVDDAALFYVREAGADIAQAFATELEATYSRIAEHPLLGSPRYGDVLRLPGLRYLKLRKFPYLVFYFDQDNEIEIWRVIHHARDVPIWLSRLDNR